MATSRVRTVRGGGAAPRTTQPAAEPWRADPDRAQRAREAAREAARQRAEQARRAPGTEAGGTNDPDRARRAREEAREAARERAERARQASGGAAGGTAGAGTGGTGRRPGSRSRQTRKATLGSTSYDEARDPLDPAWGGAAWYGPTSGEYWTVNPREYADPRKHGPEYQARGRRLGTTPTGRAGDEVRVEDAGPDLDGSVGSAGGTSPSGSRGRAGPAPDAASPPAGDRAGRGAQRPHDRWSFDPEAATGSGWSDARNPEAARAGSTGAATAGQSGAASRSAASTVGQRDARRWAPARPPDPPSAGDLGLEAARRGPSAARDPLGRLGLALVAWPPLAIAIATIVGSLTGCAEFSATCTGAAPMLPWLGQVLLLGVLLLAPPLSRALAMGTLGVLIALVPITAVLVAFGGGFDPRGGPVLADLLAAAWLVGVVFGIVSRTRPRALS